MLKKELQERYELLQQQFLQLNNENQLNIIKLQSAEKATEDLRSELQHTKVEREKVFSRTQFLDRAIQEYKESESKIKAQLSDLQRILHSSLLHRDNRTSAMVTELLKYVIRKFIKNVYAKVKSILVRLTSKGINSVG